MRIKSLADLPAAVRDRVRSETVIAACCNGEPMVRDPSGAYRSAKPSKYRNVPTIVDGRRFDSKLEARCYEELRMRVAAGEVLWFLPQVSFPLEGGVKYRCDFLVALAAGGFEVVDAKGALTQSSANKIKQVRERYGIEVKLWRGR